MDLATESAGGLGMASSMSGNGSDSPQRDARGGHQASVQPIASGIPATRRASFRQHRTPLLPLAVAFVLCGLGGCRRDVAEETSGASRVVYVRLARPSGDLEFYESDDPVLIEELASALTKDLATAGLGWGERTLCLICHQVLFMDAAGERVLGDFKIVDDIWVKARNGRYRGNGQAAAVLQRWTASGGFHPVTLSELNESAPGAVPLFWLKPEATTTQPGESSSQPSVGP